MNSQTQTETRHRCGGRHGRKKFLFIPFFIAAFIAAKSAVAMLLWNALIPELFHGPEVTYLQALGLVVLAKILVGFGGHRGGPFGRHRGPWGRKGPWGHMTPEEREALRAKLHEKLGHED